MPDIVNSKRRRGGTSWPRADGPAAKLTRLNYASARRANRRINALSKNEAVAARLGVSKGRTPASRRASREYTPRLAA